MDKEKVIKCLTAEFKDLNISSPESLANVAYLALEIDKLKEKPEDVSKPELPEELLEDKQDAVHCNCLGQHLTLFYESERHRKAVNKIIRYLRARE